MRNASQVLAMKRLSLAMRRMGTASALHSQSIAKRIGLSPVDLECLDMIYLEGPVTAGQIMQHTKLTSGAVTGLIDRLEKKGYVERFAGASDRRKVFVRIVPEKIEPIQQLYAPISASTTAHMSQHSADDLNLIAAYMEQAIDILQARTKQLDDH